MLNSLQKLYDQVHEFEELDSTNAFLKREYKNQPQLAFCTTQKQTAGYGRLGNKWNTELKDITFSVLLKFDFAVHELIGLSQLVTLLIAETLADTDSEKDLKVKWPNDVFLQNAKLAGVLIEVLAANEDNCWLVIGVGINQISSQKQQDYSSIAIEAENPTALIANISERLYYLAKNFNKSTWTCNQNAWERRDLFKLGDEIVIKKAAETLQGFYGGLDEKANLIVDFVSGAEVSKHLFSSGEVSLRKSGW